MSATAVRAEALKVCTTRLWWGLLLGMLGLIALNVVPTALFAGRDLGPGAPSVPPLDEAGGLTAVYGSGYQSGYLLAVVLGVIIAAADSRHGTATATYLATPSRGRVIAAKLLVAAGFGLLYGVIAQVWTVLVASPVVLARGAGLGLGDADVLRSLALGVPGIALWAVIGTALGVLLRNQIAGILIAVSWVFLGDFLVSALLRFAELDGVVRYTLNNASAAVVEGFTGFDLLPWWGGALVMLAYAAALATSGWFAFRRRDIG